MPHASQEVGSEIYILQNKMSNGFNFSFKTNTKDRRTYVRMNGDLFEAINLIAIEHSITFSEALRAMTEAGLAKYTDSKRRKRRKKDGSK